MSVPGVVAIGVASCVGGVWDGGLGHWGGRVGWVDEGERKKEQAAQRSPCEPIANFDRCVSLPTILEVQECSLLSLLSGSYANTTGTMDVFKAVETYVTKMVSEPSAMKVLLLDTHTVRKSAIPSTARSLTS